jgi:hypothetical protein
MSGSKKIAKGLAWLVGGRFANAAISLVSTAVLARLLGPEDFGVMAAAFVVLALANVLFDGAFGVNLIRKAALTEEDVRTTLTIAVLVGTALAALVALASPAAESFFKFKLLAPTLAISSLTIPLKAVFSVASAQLQRTGRFRVLAMASIFAQFVGYILVAVPMALMGFGVWALIAALVVAGLTEATTVGVMARLPLKPAFHREALKDIRGSGLFGLSYAFNWVANTGANAVIGRMLGAAPLGLYSRGWKLLDLVVAATATPLQRVLMPAFANIQAHPERLRRAFISALEVSLPIYALASVLLALQAPAIVSVTLGAKWSDTARSADPVRDPGAALRLQDLRELRRGGGEIRRGGLAARLLCRNDGHVFDHWQPIWNLWRRNRRFAVDHYFLRHINVLCDEDIWIQLLGRGRRASSFTHAVGRCRDRGRGRPAAPAWLPAADPTLLRRRRGRDGGRRAGGGEPHLLARPGSRRPPDQHQDPADDPPRDPLHRRPLTDTAPARTP